MWILMYRGSLQSARAGVLSERLAGVAHATTLLNLLETNRNNELRQVLERDLSFNLKAADDLACAGASPPFSPAFTGEFIESLDKAEAYIRAHYLDLTLANRARRLRTALVPWKTSNQSAR